MTNPKFIVYMTTAFVCPYCVRAKNALKEHSFTFLERDIADTAVLAELREKRPSARTVPQIFLSDGTYIGGSDELVEMIDNGKINQLLELLV